MRPFLSARYHMIQSLGASHPARQRCSQVYRQKAYKKAVMHFYEMIANVFMSKVYGFTK